MKEAAVLQRLKGGQALVVLADVSRAEAVEHAVVRLLEQFGRLDHVGTPADIADVAVWLCTDEARFNILVDGGFTIPGPR